MLGIPLAIGKVIEIAPAAMFNVSPRAAVVSVFALCMLFASACGGAAGGAVSPSGAAALSADEAEIYSYFPGDAKGYVMLDLAATRTSPLGGLLKVVDTLPVFEDSARCGLVLSEAFMRFGASLSADGEPTVAAVQTAVPSLDVMRCVGSIHGTGGASIGVGEAVDLRNGYAIAAVSPKLLVIAMGDSDALHRAIAARLPGRTPSALRSGMYHGRFVAAAESHRSDFRAFDFSLTWQAPALAFDATLACADSATAIAAHKELRAMFAGPGVERTFAQVFGTIHPTADASVSGAQLHVGARVEGTQKDFESATAGALVLGLSAFKGYVGAAKEREAKATLGQMSKLALARAYSAKDSAAAAGKRAKKGSQVRCPVSAPMTPAAPPSGVKYQSTAADWSEAGWKELGFVMSGPQYFSYGIDTAKSGAKCTLYAVADLNGDGKRVRFEAHLEVYGAGADRELRFVPGESSPVRVEP